MYFQQGRLVFPSDKRAFLDCADMIKLGAIPKERNGLRYFHRQLEHSFGSVVYFHGNAGNACDRSYFLRHLSELPYDFYFLEYPGYGDHPEKATQESILKHALSLVDEIGQKSPIVLFGESLGSGVATYVASERPDHVRGLILQAPYPNLAKVAQHHYPYIPAKLLLRHSFPASEWAMKLSKGIQPLIFVAENDQTIPTKFSYEQANNFPLEAKIQTFANSRHSSMSDDHPELYWNSIADYLEAHLMNARHRGSE